MFRILATIGLLLPTSVLADSYGECRERLLEAYQAGEFNLMETVAKQCLDIRPDYPGMLFNRALAQTLSGKPDSAIQTLAGLAERNVAFNIATEPFDQLADRPGYEELVLQFDSLREPRGMAGIAFNYHENDFVPEGIAYDERDGSLYLGSIRHSKIVRLEANGKYTPFATVFQWSVFGMRIDAKRKELWVATAAVAQGKTTPVQELGETAILRFKLRDGSLLRRYRLPRSDQQEQVLGDLVLTKSGIYTTDSLTGVVYRLNSVSGDYVTVVPGGKLNSPQGLVESADGKHLYIADYTGGLFRLRLADLDLQKVNAPTNSVLYGIDGLYRHGNDLVAIQNGIRPHRVTRIQLNNNGDTVTATEILVSGLPEFDEPTLGQVVGDQLLVIANSHWNRFNANNELDQNNLTGPVILRIKLQ